MSSILNSTLAIALSAVLGSTSISAAGKGGNPTGKPFSAINQRIVEMEETIITLQDQINILVDRVDTVEQRVIANEDAISTLHDRNAALESLIHQNLSDISSAESEIASLQQSNIDLLALIANNSGDVANLQRMVDLNDVLIKYLQNAILRVLEEAITLESSLQAQIDNNLMLIEALQTEVDTINEKLELKQNLIREMCVDGAAIQMIRADGSVVCNTHGSSQLETVVLGMVSLFVRPGSDISLNVRCPDGYDAVNAGIRGAYGWDIGTLGVGVEPELHTTYARVQARNLNDYEDMIIATATCTKITH